MRMRAAGGILACLLTGAAFVAGQHDHSSLRPALLLLRDGKTEEARGEINRLLAADASNAEIHYQLSRSYLMDFYASSDPVRSRTSLALAMEALENVLRRNRDHIPALKSKAVIHARAELLYYNPNLAYELGARIAKLQPSANEYLLSLTDWLSGEVRFTTESGHRVPHDPLTGLDRSIELLDRVIDSAMPYSNEEAMGFYQMGKTLSKRGNYREAVKYFQRALGRPPAAPFTSEILREMGASLYRNGEYAEAARSFYRAVQAQPNLVDRWLLRVALEQSKEAGIRLPAGMDFPVIEPAIDPANPPLLAFEDMAKELGVNRFDGNGTCAFGDYDGDGKLDLLLAGSGTFLGLYKNDGKRFHDATAEAGLANVPSGYSLNFVDYDNDGRLDIYLALNGWNGPMPNRLLRNMGGGKFKDVSKESGTDDAGSGFVSLWGDLDNDGFLDFVVANGVLKDGSVPQIYRNNGDGTFANVTRQAGLNEPATHGTIGAALGDYDRDGDLDLFLNGLQNSPNRLYRNDGKLRFTEVSKAADVTQPNHMGYVAFFTDYNNDAWPDLLATSLAPWDAVVQSLSRFFKPPDNGLHPDSVRLFRNNRDGTFTDATRAAQLHYPMGVMGAGVADLDNDGHVDFYFGTGDPQLSRIEPNRFFRNNGNGTFTDLTRYVGLAQPGKKGHGVCFVDIDDDGDLELYAQLGGHYPGDHAENAFYRNLKGNGNHWLQVELVGTKSNRNGIGAGVVLTAGEHKLYQEVKGSEGFGSTNPYRLHFGLGQRTTVDSLEILWPSGVRQTLKAVEADRLIQVKEAGAK